MSIRWRPDRGKWQASVTVRGKRRRPLFGTKREAVEFDRKNRLGKFGLKEEQSESTLISSGFASYFETESSFKSKKSKDNDKRYLNFAFHFFTVERGHEYLSDIQLEDLQAFQQWIEKAHTAGEDQKEAWALPTVARCCKMMKHLFHKLAMTKRIKEDPALYWSIPAGESKRRRPMTAWEFEQLLSASDDWYKPILRFMRLTGARGSSVAGLTWGDADLARRLMVLKSGKGARQKIKLIPHPIIDELFAVLVTERNARPWAGPTEPVFLTQFGEKIDPRWISQYGNRLIKKVGLEGVVLYGLRHGLATDMTDAGVSLEIIRQTLGHSSVQTTQNYARGIGMGSVAKAIDSVRGVTEVTPTGTKKGEGDA